MTLTDKLLSRIGGWRSKIQDLIFSTLAFRLMAGAVLVSLWGRIDSDGSQAHMAVLIVQWVCETAEAMSEERVSMEVMVQVHALSAAVST